MLTKEQLVDLQNQVPVEYKYFFEYDCWEDNYEQFILDGMPNLSVIQQTHKQHIIDAEELGKMRKAIRDKWLREATSRYPVLLRFLTQQPS